MKNLLHKGWGAIPIVIGISFSVPAFAISHTALINNEQLINNNGGDPSFVGRTESAVTADYAKQQQNLITGIVTFEGMPMTGVTVKIESSTQKAESSGQNAESSRQEAERRTQNAERSGAGTVTDVDGKFSIEAQAGDVLVFSYTGFKTQRVTVGSQTYLTIALEEDTNALKEVIVNAGYYNVKDSERTGSIAKITSKAIEKQPVTNVLAAMQGRMAGVDIIQESGAPGGAFRIKIRGINSMRADGNEPLYVVDGVPFSSETVGYNRTSNTNPSMTNPLNSINPSDIESIEVLKDADATSIYGSRGANGVVLITTKKGKAGKTKFTVNASTGFGRVTSMLDLMSTDQFLDMRRQAFANDGFTELPDYAYDVNGTWDQSRYTDWQKVLIGGTAEIRNVQASVSGGSAGTQYLLSGTYRTETTVQPGDFQYDKAAVHFNMTHTSDDRKFKLQFSSGYTAQNNNQPAVDLTYLSRTLAPNAPALYDENGGLNWEDSTWDNPLAALLAKFTAKTNGLNANATLSYQFTDDLQLKTSLGYNDLVNDERKATPNTIYNPSYGVTSASSNLHLNRTGRQSWIIEPQLDWNKQVGKGKVEALLGATAQYQNTDRMFQYGFNFSSNSLINNLASAGTKAIYRSDATEYKYQAFYARVNYNYDGRYIVNVTGRRDGSSRFGPGRQFANFGAVGAAWLFSEEGFLKDNRVLSFGKLRGSYGITGNDQIGDYQYLDTYTTTGTNYQGTIGLQPTRLYNPAFGWESNKKLEAALETGFFNDRIFFTAAWYQNRSGDQLVGVPLPGTTGFINLTANLDATVENSGFEFTLRTENFKGANFSWSTDFNIAANRNRLLSFPGLAGSTYANTFVIGESLNIYKRYHFTGMNPETGIYEFEDYNGDGRLTSPEDRQVISDITPQYFGGIQNQFNYKGVQLDFLFQFAKQKRFRYLSGVPGDGSNQLASVSDNWQSSGDRAVSQPYTTGNNSAVIDAYGFYADSDAAITDASYVRLKNISLSYDLPLPTSQPVRCKIYVQGQNLLTLTHYEGDPEMPANGYLPPLKVVSAGVQFTF